MSSQPTIGIEIISREFLFLFEQALTHNEINYKTKCNGELKTLDISFEEPNYKLDKYKEELLYKAVDILVSKIKENSSNISFTDYKDLPTNELMIDIKDYARFMLDEKVSAFIGRGVNSGKNIITFLVQFNME